MTEQENEDFTPRERVIVFCDEDVDGLTSAAIVGRKYDEDKTEFIFVNARNLGRKLKQRIEDINFKQADNLDIFIVDVGINKANIKSIENSIKYLTDRGIRVYYFDSHSNKYKGKPLMLYLRRANANVFHGKIGSAAASIVQDFMGTEETKRLRLLGALSDREIRLTRRYRHEKGGLRALQAAVAWGAWQDKEFLDKVTRRLIRNPQIDLESDRDIIKYAIKANNHRDNLLRHVFRRGKVLEISQTPRILAVTVLDRDDFGKARGTIAGRLAGEWGAAIILVTRAVNAEDSYAVTVRNSYSHKLDLEALGQLSQTKNSGGSKGAYRLTIKKDNLLIFLSKVQAWARELEPPWLGKKIPKQYFKKKRRGKSKTQSKKKQPKSSYKSSGKSKAKTSNKSKSLSKSHSKSSSKSRSKPVKKSQSSNPTSNTKSKSKVKSFKPSSKQAKSMSNRSKSKSKSKSEKEKHQQKKKSKSKKNDPTNGKSSKSPLQKHSSKQKSVVSKTSNKQVSRSSSQNSENNKSRSKKEKQHAPSSSEQSINHKDKEEVVDLTDLD